MLAIVRVKIRLKETSSRGVVSLQTGNIDKVWRRVVRNSNKWDDTGARIVYLTHRSLQEDISMIFDAKSMDSITNFVFKHVAPMQEVAAIRILGLMNPRFFRIPKGYQSGLKRFTTSVSVEPNMLDDVYEYLSSFAPSKALVPVYLACTFNGSGRDLIFSFLAPGETTAKRFVSSYIDDHDGIQSTRTTYMSQSKRLASREGWRELIKKFLVEPGDIELDDIDVYEEDFIASC